MKKNIAITCTILVIGTLWMADVQDRYETSLPKYFSKEETFFFYHKTLEESQEVIKTIWNRKEYQFPREEIKTIKYYKNVPLISRLISKELTREKRQQMMDIINDSNNFDWGETTWGIKDSHYFFRFFDEKDNEVGKLWICYDACGMTKIIPWIPTTKYGALSDKGKSKFAELVNGI